MVERLANDHWDLGSNPRSPQNAYVIFLYMFLCRSPKGKHHIPPNINAPCGFRRKSKGHEMMTTMRPVNEHTANPESQSRLEVNGLQIAKNTSLLGQHPPGSFILFFLFSFSNYYYYYLINIINYFHNKLRIKYL